jgi:hypothetical protein
VTEKVCLIFFKNMKRLFLLAAFVFLIVRVYGQGTQVGDSSSPIYHYNGNVGIGTTSPNHKLEVNGGALLKLTAICTVAGSSDNSWVRDTWLTSNGVNISWDQTAGKWKRNSATYNDFGGFIFQDEGTYFVREPAGTKLEYTNTEFLNEAHFFVDIQSGNMGIGTTTPDYKLDVLGTIRANEVKVVTGWSDFVFESDYDLPTLQEVETYIDLNGHLPDIPSAEEVEENGISLGEMDAKLLKKIEELTLYVIELKKENEDLKAKGNEIDELKEMVQQLLGEK